MRIRSTWRSRRRRAAGLAGRVVIVTGASSGIGEATARRLADEGARVTLAARRRDRLETIAAQIRAAGADARAVEADITSPEDRQRIVSKTLDAFGRVDGLVNNAGYGQRGPVEVVPLAEIRRNFETNLFSLIGLTQLVIPLLRAQGGGRIVNVSSVAGRIVWPFSAVYGSTKHALEAISDGLRGELAPFGIQVVVVQPGFVLTEFGRVADAVSRPTVEASGPYAPRVERAGRRLELAKRLAGTPEQIADLIAEALTAPHPRTRYAAPLHARGALLARRFLPEKVFDAALSASRRRA